jgi:FAD/FMN-containing dehydrogenase
MACVNLLVVEVVTAAGQVLVANATQNPELFWACRGGGGDFGVVTSFVYELHPLGPIVHGGILAYPIDRARDALAFYRVTSSDLPDEWTLFCGQLCSPDGHPIVAFITCHTGSAEQAAEAFAKLRAFGAPAMDALGPIPYAVLNGILDGGFPRGARNYWKSGFLKQLDDATLDALAACYARCPSPMSGLILENFHGAVTRVAPDATAFPHRGKGYNVAIASQWMDPTQDAANIAWARETHAALRPHMAAAVYANYLPDDETGRQADIFGGNVDRLRAVKRALDPDGVFRPATTVAE